MYSGLIALTFGLCAITGSQARLALSVAFWLLLNHKVSPTIHALRKLEPAGQLLSFQPKQQLET